MSPSNAMERSYTAIKVMLRKGVFVSGARLEANRLAYELGVSITPVRDVLYRLAGEQLVKATLGDGFHVPRFSEAGLRDLYEWNSVLMSFASKTSEISTAMAVTADSTDLANRMTELIERIATATPNRELGEALRNASDRLQPFRIAEAAVFADIATEFAELQQHPAGVATAIRRYHVRRMRAVSELLGARDRR